MNREIINDNLYLLLPSKASQFARIYMEMKGGNVLDAIRALYYSNTYKELEKEETKIWHYGPVALYEEFEEKDISCEDN
ncbi:MAG: hypothetical protein IJ494_03165 [Bacteroides sp.]|nr:hypothetical protein [Bacteroides sp.]